MTPPLPFVDAETANRLLREIADEKVKEILAVVDAIAPGGVVPTVFKNPPRDRLIAFLDDTYAPDLPGALDKNWVGMVKAGTTLPPVSPFWAMVMSLPTEAAKSIQADFQAQWSKYVVRGE